MKSHCVTIRTPRVRNINIHIDINIYHFLQCMTNVRHYIVCVWLGLCVISLGFVYLILGR